MHFELLQLYRNYRNIESLNVEIENSESIVFGHFDRITFSQTDTADDALEKLYSQYLDENRNLGTDVQPMILWSFEDRIIEYNDRFMAISFMQINKPEEGKTIKDFYKYTVKAIGKIIKKLKDKKLIGDVDYNVYIPLSFMNASIAFYASNYTDICIVIKNIIHSGLARFQYSVLSMPKQYGGLLEPEKEINISLRFIWKENVNINNAINLLKDSLESFKDKSINYLLGNNDCLLLVPNLGYRMLSLMLTPQGSFKEFLEYVENTRATINFPEKDIRLIKLSFDKGKNTLFTIDDSQIFQAETSLINKLKELKCNAPEFQQSDISDIIYRVNEFGKFMDVIKKHAVKGIATQLYLSMRDPYLLFLQKTQEKLMDDTCPINDLLEIVGNVINDMSTYFGNIFHCNLGFFEERGFYNNIIGLASNVELAYNKYANCISAAIMSDEERNIDKLKICCSVTSDKEPLICTHDIFESIAKPEHENSSLVNINIPVSYVFKYAFVSRVIIHEIAHHVGDRKREERTKAICSVFASVIVDPIFQTFSHALVPKVTEYEKKFLEKFENTMEYKELHRKTTIQIHQCIEDYITESVVVICDGHYFLNNVVDAIVETINKLSCDDLFIEELSNYMVDFQFWYYELFENFYLKEFPERQDTLKIMTEMSEYALKDYNLLYVRKTFKDLFNDLVSIHQTGEYIDTLNERTCWIYLPDIENFIEVFFNAISEAFCDLMMITLSEMSFKEYLQLMFGYGKEIENIIVENDYLTWLRINFIANYMGQKIPYKFQLPERFKYYNDINVFNLMKPYFDELRTEVEAAHKRCHDDLLLSTYLKKISSNSEEKHLSAIFDMFFGITDC